MTTHMPIWLFILSLLIFISITIIAAVFYFKTQGYKKRIILKNESLPETKQIRLKWYQNWGPILHFLFAVIGALGILAIFSLYLA